MKKYKKSKKKKWANSIDYSIFFYCHFSVSMEQPLVTTRHPITGNALRSTYMMGCVFLMKAAGLKILNMTFEMTFTC